MLEYRRFCKWIWFSVKSSIPVSTQGSIFEKNTSVLKTKNCPKGPSETTTEESAAHHVLAKGHVNIPEKRVSIEFSIFRCVPENLRDDM